MAKKSLVEKWKKEPKFSSRKYSRCEECKRPKSVYKMFNLCRICLRKFICKGWIPGWKKASW